jgi:hypothetical protein
MKKFTAVLFAAVLAALTLFPAQEAGAQAVQVCHAETTCPGGGFIQCTVYGHVRNGAGACFYGYRVGVDVWCRGFVLVPGIGWMWQEYYSHC